RTAPGPGIVTLAETNPSVLVVWTRASSFQVLEPFAWKSIRPDWVVVWSAGRNWPQTVRLLPCLAFGSQIGTWNAANDGFWVPFWNSSPVWNVLQYRALPLRVWGFGGLSTSRNCV